MFDSCERPQSLLLARQSRNQCSAKQLCDKDLLNKVKELKLTVVNSDVDNAANTKKKKKNHGDLKTRSILRRACVCEEITMSINTRNFELETSCVYNASHKNMCYCNALPEEKRQTEIELQEYTRYIKVSLFILDLLTTVN